MKHLPPFLWRFTLLYWLTTLPFAADTHDHLHSKKCGTVQLFLSQSQGHAQHLPDISIVSSNEKKAANQTTPIATRMYQSEHFVFYYSLESTHVPVLVEGESSLPTQADSIQTANGSSLQEAYDVMDQNTFPHPQYILKNAEYFEKAWDHYIDTLNMRVPSLTTDSRFFKRTAVPGKYPVEIGHIAALEPSLSNYEIYGIAYSPGIGGGGILMDNDFRWGLPPRDLITRYTGVVPNIVNNYYIDWDKALQVTAAHEFYHAVQYAYTPVINSFHYWYELSATGMEERLAPDVNDYLQYLPALFETHSTYSLNNLSASSIQTYGRGIFHQFLTQEIGKDFDVEVWDNLSTGQSIDSALENMLSNNNRNIRDIYAKYTQPLPFTQPTSSLLPGYSPDHSLWPRITPIFLQGNMTQFSLPPLTYEAIDLSSAPSARVLVFDPTESEGVTLTVVYADSVHTHILSRNESFLVPLSSQPSTLILSNGSWGQSANIILSLSNVEAYPNPVLSNTPRIQFSEFVLDTMSSFSGDLHILNEQGTIVHSTTLSEQQNTWDLRDDTSNRVPSGVYYYTVTGQSAKVLYVQ
jgi:hypothetical protein